MTTPDLKLCALQVNTGLSGWRNVMQFEVQDADDVMDLAEKLFEWGYTPNVKGFKLRIMKPGDSAPLMTWTDNDGWQEWRGAV